MIHERIEFTFHSSEKARQELIFFKTQIDCMGDGESLMGMKDHLLVRAQQPLALYLLFINKSLLEPVDTC